MVRPLSHLCVVLFLACFVSISICAQSSETCPTITVTGPSGEVGAVPFKFTAIVNPIPDTKIGFKWMVSNGKIIDGQGTTEITAVDTQGEGSITGTVEVSGLPSGCVATASETTGPIETEPAVLIDEVELSISRIPEQTLRTAAEETRSNPKHRLYVIAYTDKSHSPSDVRESIEKMSEFLIKEMKLSAQDFEIEAVSAQENRTRLYRLPPGASNPTP